METPVVELSSRMESSPAPPPMDAVTAEPARLMVSLPAPPSTEEVMNATAVDEKARRIVACSTINSG